MERQTVDKRLWLPTSAKEVELRGWSELDVVIFSGDAYVDHPSFGTAVIGRVIEHAGYRVAIVPQPNWRDDLRDFKKFGRPRLFFGVNAGVMDSMVNHYTAAKRRRSNDAYTPDERADMRPDYPTIVYSQALRKFFPDVPIVLGGVEASLRRLTHYDYWQDRLLPSMIIQSPADLIIYGMGERSIVAICRALDAGQSLSDLHALPQLVYHVPHSDVTPEEGDIVLHSHEECLRNKKAYAENFRHIEEQSNSIHAHRLLQRVGDEIVVVNPPYPPMDTEEIDQAFDLPYTRLPHPRYKGKRIPAYEMIRHSINLHRGCFGGCAFCTISAHQGKFISSRSKASILREAKMVTQMEDFKGYISDLGGPSANMYRIQGKKPEACERCLRPSCISPSVCPNLNADHTPLIDILRSVDALPRVKKSFVGSGIRYDLLLHDYKDLELKKAAAEYTKEIITKHVSGRLKVAPEHTADHVLGVMRKPSFKLFHQFKQTFDRLNREAGLNQQLIPYFISSHPGCRMEDMAELAAETKALDFKLEQVQDFTPTPMTVATVIYYSGYHPYTLEPLYTARTKEQKEEQRQFFFWYQREERPRIISSLKRIGRQDLIDRLFGKHPSKSSPKPAAQTKHRRPHTKRHK